MTVSIVMFICGAIGYRYIGYMSLDWITLQIKYIRMPHALYA